MPPIIPLPISNAMRILTVCCLIALLGGPWAFAQQPVDPELPDLDSGHPDASLTVLVGGQLIDVTTGAAQPHEATLISNGRLLRVNDDVDAIDDAVMEEAYVVELESDQYVLPGIVDLHAHYNMDLVGHGRVEEVVYNPLAYLANGATTTFTGGEYDPEVMEAARNRINRGEQLGPRILAAGPYIGRSNPDWDSDYTADDIHALVDEWAERGVAGFKAKGASPEHLEPAIERAHQHGLTVTGHLDSGWRGSTNSKDAIRMGVDRVEHILGGHVLDREEAAYPVWNDVDTTSADFQDIVQMFLDHRVHFSATMTAPVYFAGTEGVQGFDDWADEQSFFTPYVQEVWAERKDEATGSDLMESLYAAMQRSTKAFYDAGGGDLIVLGTDKPAWGDFLPGYAVHREMHAMVMAGIPEASVLRIATKNGAEAIGMGDRLGTLEPGRLADLFVVSGNPLDDITNTRNVQLVMKDGRLYDPEALLAPARGAIGPEGPDDHENWTR